MFFEYVFGFGFNVRWVNESLAYGSLFSTYELIFTLPQKYK